MDKITWLALAAELEIELIALRGKVLSRCLTQSQAIGESLEMGLNELHDELDMQVMSDSFVMSELSKDLWLSIKNLEVEMGLHLACPY